MAHLMARHSYSRACDLASMQLLMENTNVIKFLSMDEA
jgi:hypothetical protein